MKIKIKTRQEKPFQSDNGGEVKYFWYTGFKEDGFLIRFGSTKGDHKEGKTEDIDLEEFTTTNGKKQYKEVL